MWFNREQLISIFIITGLFSLFFILKVYNYQLFLDSNLNKGSQSPLFSINLNENIIVEIRGAIKRAGKYHLKEGSRYFDLIQLAGGFRKTADKSRITKNYFLKDGQKFYVPFKKKPFERKKISTNRNKWIEVEIRGAVKKPGVYKLKSGNRFSNLVNEAGGFKLRANRKKKYRNYFLKDGQTFYVPYK